MVVTGSKLIIVLPKKPGTIISWNQNLPVTSGGLFSKIKKHNMLVRISYEGNRPMNLGTSLENTFFYMTPPPPLCVIIFEKKCFLQKNNQFVNSKR